MIVNKNPKDQYLHQPPTSQYSGLTIILSNKSRFDLDHRKLLSGSGGYFFDTKCLAPHLDRTSCDTRLADDPTPLLPNTKCLLLLGEYAHTKWSKLSTTLDENRGSPYFVDGIPCIASFFPQDATDPVELESKLNPDNKSDEDIQMVSIDKIMESKSKEKTSRANYRFWLQRDVEKAVNIINNGGKLPSSGITPNYMIKPDESYLIDLLTQTKDQHMFFDIETDFINYDMRCFAFSFSNNPENIYIVPTLDHNNYTPCYSYHNSRIHWALTKAIRNNILVAHNGAHFDYFILAHKYGIPIDKVYDTMVAQHRIYPTIEKSLGHCVSLWTYEGYHKNEGEYVYQTYEQAEKLYRYCGKDVFTMYLIWKKQCELMAKDEGLAASIQLANDAIKPYLTTTLMGMKFNPERRDKWIADADKLSTFYFKVIADLTGPTVQPLISNKTCTEYFHRQMGYNIVKKTSAGGASLDEDALIKLALEHNNPVINFLLRYRGKQKECSTLRFKVWKEKDKTNEQNSSSQSSPL